MLINLIKHERYNYSDCFTQFFEELYINSDLEEAQKKLTECTESIKTDFFLQPLAKEIINSSRMAIFELICATHNCIDLSKFSNTISKEEAELWIVNLTRNHQFDAKIDSENNIITITTRPSSIHQQLAEKIDGILLRTGNLSHQILSHQK
jgi:hypothetical protein